MLVILGGPPAASPAQRDDAYGGVARRRENPPSSESRFAGQDSRWATRHREMERYFLRIHQTRARNTEDGPGLPKITESR